MLLIEIRDFLQARHGASLGELCRHFRLPESAMQGMLEHWLRKGRVVKLTAPCADHCGQCVGESEWYRWQGRARGMIPISKV
jgi:putative ferrous iron transport protein C